MLQKNQNYIDSTQKRPEIHGYYVFKMLRKITAN